MIRPAAFPDLARVKVLFHEMHAASKYAGRVGISAKALDEVLGHSLMKQRSPMPGGSFFHVAEHKGEVHGFMIGALDRIYHIGTMMVAQDLFLHVADTGRATDAIKLIRAYVDWARLNPKVLEINLSWTDTLADAQKVEKVYERLGFKRCGGIFSMAIDAQQVRAAA